MSSKEMNNRPGASRRAALFTAGFALLALVATMLPAPAQEAPNVPLYDLSGARHILHSLVDGVPGGGVLVINFTSINCKPCKKEIPELLAIVEDSKKVKLLFIYAEASRDAAPHARELGADEHAYVDPLGAIQSKYGVKSYPVTVVIDKKYTIVGRFEGYTPANMEALRKLVER